MEVYQSLEVSHCYVQTHVFIFGWWLHVVVSLPANVSEKLRAFVFKTKWLVADLVPMFKVQYLMVRGAVYQNRTWISPLPSALIIILRSINFSEMLANLGITMQCTVTATELQWIIMRTSLQWQESSANSIS